MIKQLILALVACTMIVGCSDTPQTIVTENTFNLPEYIFDADGDGAPDLMIGGMSVTSVCETLPDGVETCMSQVKSALKGVGDCDSNKADDPDVCWVWVDGVKGDYAVDPTDCNLATNKDFYQCAPCINPGAPEVPGDGVDNNCDGMVDNCNSDNDCNDSNDCTTDSCNLSTQQCVNSPKSSGTTCSDNSVCTQQDQCDGAGVCTGALLDCNDGNMCTEDNCNATLGCLHTPMAEGAACDDNNLCTTGEMCTDGLCTDGEDKVCDDGVDCTDDLCNPATGCASTVNDDNCDSDLCTDSVCDAVLDCVDTPVDCDDGIDCTLDFCDYQFGCTSRTSDSVCADGAACNGDEVCDGLVGCLAGPPLDCDDGLDCTIDSCNEAGGDGLCEYAPNNAVCDNTLYCDGTEVCTVGTGCEAGTPPDVDDGVDCTVDSCNEAIDQVVHVSNNDICDDGVGCTDDICNGLFGCFAVPNHGACDDAQFCNGTEMCDVDDGCVDGTAPVCDDVVTCTVDSCDEATDSCMNVADDSLCDDKVGCTVDVCDPTSGDPSLGCVYTPDNTLCDNGAFCDGVESCHVTDDCQDGNPPEISDNVNCTTDACDEATDTITNVVDDGYCDDGLFCTGVETCDLDLGCLTGTAPTASDGVDCTVDSCDETIDQIEHTPVHGSCPVPGELCDPIQVAGLPSAGCFPPVCDPANDEGGEADSDCNPLRDKAGVPADYSHPLMDHYGFGCLGGACAVYEDNDFEEWSPLTEEICDDNIDGDLDGFKDSLDTNSCGPCTTDCLGKVCGDDGCAGSCGTCQFGETCNAGLCEAGAACVDNADCPLGQDCLAGECTNMLTDWINCWDGDTGTPPAVAPSCDFHYADNPAYDDQDSDSKPYLYVCWSPNGWDYTLATPTCDCYDWFPDDGISSPAASPQVVMCCRNTLGVVGCGPGEVPFQK